MATYFQVFQWWNHDTRQQTFGTLYQIGARTINKAIVHIWGYGTDSNSFLSGGAQEEETYAIKGLKTEVYFRSYIGCIALISIKIKMFSKQQKSKNLNDPTEFIGFQITKLF